MPGEEGGEVQRRQRTVARAAGDPEDFRVGARRRQDSVYGEVSRRVERGELVFRELAKMAEGSGLDAVAMHARTREQGYSGQAQWQWIAELKSLVSIPVIGNGDIRTPEDARAMVAETGCDGGDDRRAAASNPWIFRQISQYTASGNYEVASEPTGMR